MNQIDRQKRIDNCGRGVTAVTDTNGVEQLKRLLCGYMECRTCYGIELNKRGSSVRSVINSHDGLFFRAEINVKTDWGRMHKNFRRNGINYIKVPISNDVSIVYSSGDPSIADIDFIEVSDISAINELTEEHMLFACGQRSSSRNWPLKKKKVQDNSESSTVIFFYPFLHPPQDGSFNVQLMNKLKYFASTWSKGRVTLDNIQEYIRYKKNKYVELALEFGYRLDIEKSSLAKETFTTNQIAGWTTNSVDNHITDTAGMFDNDDARLFSIAMDIVDPTDYMQMKLDSLDRDELENLGIAYIFYPEVNQQKLDAILSY
jgi:hypothetical protein